MGKLKIKLSHIQIIGTALCCIVITVGIIFGAFTKSSYLKMTQDKSSISNAVLFLDDESAYYLDYQYSVIDFDSAIYELENYSYIFKIKCVDSKLCYDCTRYTVNVIDTIKGDTNENGNDIVLYQWLGFDKISNDKLAFSSPDFSMPLKPNKEYLVFAEKRDYYSEYQKTLPSNEYSLGVMGICPKAFVINDTQNTFADVKSDKTYSDIENLYYLCFSQEALENINKLSGQIISYYCK